MLASKWDVDDVQNGMKFKMGFKHVDDKID